MRRLLPTSITKFVLIFTVMFSTAVLGLFTLPHVFAAAGINAQINFQGKLVDNAGLNVADGSKTVIFSIYDLSSGGTALWTETQSVTTADGIFRASLGSVTPFPSNFNFNWDGLYLGIKVGADSEMTPRIRMAAVPYAMNAQKVAGLTVQDTSGNASTSGILQIANGKTVTFGDAFSTTVGNSVAFTTGGVTTLTLPTTGTLATLLGNETLNNKIIGSAGLIFNGAATDITTGTNEDLVIVPNGTGNVGIGMTNPLFKLAVSTSVAGDGFRVYNSSSLGAGSGAGIVGLVTTDPTASDQRLGFYLFGSNGANQANSAGMSGYSSQAWTSAAKGTYLTFETTADGATARSERLRIASSGNIGIGSTTPIGLLNVDGKATGKALAIFNQNGGNQAVFTASISGATKFIVDSSGNVGIGTTTAASELYVKYATANSTATVPVLSLDNPTGGTQTSMSFKFNGSAKGIITVDSGGSLKLSSNNSATTYIGYNSLGTPGAINFGNGLLTMDASGNLAATGTLSGLTGLTLASGAINLGGTVGTGSQCLLGGATAAWGSCGSGTSQWTTSTSDIYYNTGNVGIGTTTMSTGVLNVGMSASGTGLYFNAPGSSPNIDINSINGSGIRLYAGSSYATGPAFQIWDSNSVYKGMYFDAGSVANADVKWRPCANSCPTPYMIFKQGSGYLGIGKGNTSPLTGFDVRPSNDTGAIASISGASTFAGLVIDNSGSGDVFTASTSGMTRLVVKQNGNVGIGTAIPTAKFDLNGDMEFETMTNPTCSAGDYKVWANATDTKLKKCENGTITDLDTTSGAGGLPQSANFTDSTTDTMADNNTTDLWDGTYPNLTPTSATSTILVSAVVNVLAASTDDEIDAFQVHRTIGGTTSSCSGTAVGPTFSSGFATSTSENPTATVVFIDTPATTSQVNYTVCSSVNSTGTVNNTTPKITVGLVELGADLAENYYTKDAAIGAGDIVSADPTLPAGAKKSTSAYDSSILGIVSTKPGAVLDDGIGLNQGRQIPVALSGRVPLKVTTENGVIKPGDLITSSSLPGVGMKATKAGQIVGQALTGFDGQGVGQVFVFVKTNFGQGDITSLASGLDSTTILGKDILAQFMLNSNSLTKTTSSSAVSSIVTDRVAAGLEVVTPHLIAHEVSADVLSIASGSALTVRLGTDGKVVFGDSPDTGITFDNKGNATFAGTITAKSIKADQIEGLELLIGKITTIKSGMATSSADENASVIASEGKQSLLGIATSSATPYHEDNGYSVASRNDNMDINLNSLGVTGIATFSGDFRVKGSGLIEGMLNVVDSFTANDIVINGLATFFDNVVFKKDVTFEGRPTVNNDTAGFAVIKKGDTSVDVTFKKEYETLPVINASIVSDKTDKTEDQQAADMALLAANTDFVMTHRSKKGFTILLKKASRVDLNFSWIAVSVKDAATFESDITPTPTANVPSE